MSLQVSLFLRVTSRCGHQHCYMSDPSCLVANYLLNMEMVTAAKVFLMGTGRPGLREVEDNDKYLEQLHCQAGMLCSYSLGQSSSAQSRL